MKFTVKLLLALLIGTLLLSGFTACQQENSLWVDDGTANEDEDKDNDRNDKGDDPAKETTAPNEEQNKPGIPVTDDKPMTTDKPVTTDKPDTNEAPGIHTHTAGDWTITLKRHLHICTKCGSEIDSSAHTLEDGVCTGCGCEIYSDDEYSFVTVYNEHGDILADMTYDENDNLFSAQINRYTYDNDGNMLTFETDELDEKGNRITFYTGEYTYNADGSTATYATWHENRLTYSCEYAVDSEGYEYITTDTTYEGEYAIVCKYDEAGETTSEYWYDKQGVAVDFSTKFDPAECAPLFGNWICYADLGELMFPDVETDASLPATFRLTFSEDGKMNLAAEINPDEFRACVIQATIDVLTQQLAESNISPEVFETIYGKTIEEYVIDEVDSMDLEEQMKQADLSKEGLYYLEDGKLYIADHKHQRGEENEFLLNGNKFTLIDPSGFMNLEFTKVN